MNYPIIFKMLSLVLWTTTVAFSLCAGVSQIYAAEVSEAEAMPSWVCAIALSAMSALAFYLPSRNAPTNIQKKEAMCIVGVGWILVSILGAVPYFLILACPFPDAIFESASGITTTGASIFGDVESIPRSLLFWRALSQWIGGLGVVLFFVAIISFLGSGAKTLYMGGGESGTHAGDVSDYERIQSATMRILAIYVIISLICLAAFRLTGMGWFDGICHMLATVSTGGFSVYNDSIAHYKNSLIDWTVIFFMTLGGVNFMTIIMFLRGNFKMVFRNTEFKTYIAILASVSVAIAIILLHDKNLFTIDTWSNAITKSAFQTVSIMTTTGFATSNYQEWLPFTHVALFIIMILGGCAGSTAGGLKVLRGVVAFKFVKRDIVKSFRPRLVLPLRLNGKVLDTEDADTIMSHICLYSIICIFGFWVLAALEPDMSFSGCISAVVSCTSNAGPGLAEVGPVKNYGFMNGASKIFLSCLMVMGRLEFYSILVLFMPSLWRKFQ